MKENRGVCFRHFAKEDKNGKREKAEGKGASKSKNSFAAADYGSDYPVGGVLQRDACMGVCDAGDIQRGACLLFVCGAESTAEYHGQGMFG